MLYGCPGHILAPPGLIMSPPGRISVTLGTGRDVRLVRNKTMDFEVLGVVTRQERSKTLPFFSTTAVSTGVNSLSNTRPQTEVHLRPEQTDRYRFPVLGPTRQQTELYLKKKKSKKKYSVLPVNGPDHDLSIGGRTLKSSELPVFEGSSVDAVLFDAEARLRAGLPALGVNSMNTRRGKLRLSDEFDSQPDVRFFSELVKPLQYKWRLQQQKDMGKIVTPSKHGFHPRSQSPTFKRLVEATEKLQIIVEDDSGMGSIEKIEDDEAEIQSCFSLEKIRVDEALTLPPLRLTQSETLYSISSNEPHKTFTDQNNSNQIVVPKVEPNQETVEPESLVPLITKVATINVRPANSTSFDSEEETTPLQPSPKIREFKVDFKQVDSHAELHLFLPHIEGMNRVETPEVTKVSRTGKISLPAIENTNQNKAETKTIPFIGKKLKRSRSESKKKVKSKARVNSGKGDKVLTDVLNDVSTLISIENEKSHVTNGICPFENCAYHAHLVKT